MNKKQYIHTLNGKPAVYRDGFICFACGRVKNPAKDLRQIHREQIRDIDNRQSADFTTKFKHGHCIIYLPV